MNSASTQINRDAWKLYGYIVHGYFFVWGLCSVVSQVLIWIYFHPTPEEAEGAAFLFHWPLLIAMILALALHIIGITLGLIGFRDRVLLLLGGLSAVKLLLVIACESAGCDVVIALAIVIIPVIRLIRRRQKPTIATIQPSE